MLYRTTAQVTKGEQIKVLREVSLNNGASWTAIDSYLTADVKIEPKSITRAQVKLAYMRLCQPSAKVRIRVPKVPKLESTEAERTLAIIATLNARLSEAQSQRKGA